MKFRTKEELKQDKKINYGYYDLYTEALDLAFKSFKERIDFFKKFHDSPFHLQEKHPKTYEKFENQITLGINGLQGKGYREWFFDYCFGDIE